MPIIDDRSWGDGCAGSSSLAADSAAAILTIDDRILLKTPAIAVSPDGSKTLVVYVQNRSASSGEFLSDPVYSLDNGGGYASPTSILPPGDDHTQLDTAVSFFSNTEAVAVWTENRLTEAAEGAMGSTIADFNTVFKNKDIVYCRWNETTGWSTPASVTNDPPAHLRADGLPQVAGLPSRNAALVAWVRYNAAADMFDSLTGDVDLRGTSVVAGRIDFATGMTPPVNVSSMNEPVPAMDGEPTLAAAPNGLTAMLVWVRDLDGDENTAHDRFLMGARWTPVGGWDVPVPLTDPAILPGAGSPAVTMYDSDSAIVAFTSRSLRVLRDGTKVIAGEGNKDLVQVLELRNGTWQTPVELQINSDTRSGRFYGRTPQPVYLNENAVAVVCRNYDGFGRDGGDGELSIALGDLRQPPFHWSKVRDLTDDTLRDWEIAAALKGSPGAAVVGPVIRTVRDSAAGLTGYDGLLFADIGHFEPDLSVAIEDFDEYAAPGSSVTLRATIGNEGLYWPMTPETTTIRIGTVDTNGTFQELDAQSFTYGLRPDETAEVVFTLTVPSMRTQLRVAADPLSTELEANELANNAADAWIGVPAPENFTYTAMQEGSGYRVEFHWNRTGEYERLIFSRDGVPRWVLEGSDLTTSEVPVAPGTYTWSLQAAVGRAYSEPVSLTVTLPELPSAAVVGRFVFYNHSWFDGNKAAIDPAPIVGGNNDDADAIDNGGKMTYPGGSPPAVDYRPKRPLLAGGGCATFANWTGYAKGINGLIYDLADTARAPLATDFVFRTIGNTGSSTPAVVKPTAFVVQPGGGWAGSDRVVITFADGAILNTWLQVDIGTGFGLAAAETHFWGNAPGDTGQGNTPPNALVNPSDEIWTRMHPTTPFNRSPVFDACDINKDSLANPADQIYVRTHPTTPFNCLKMICR